MRYLLSFFVLFVVNLPFTPLAHTQPLPETIESSITEIFEALNPANELPLPAIKNILDFITQNNPESAWAPAPRFDESNGIFLQDTINVPIQDVLAYILDMNIPGEAVYLNSVRTNYWVQPSAVRDAIDTMLKSPLPPKAPLILRGEEFEETTPDTTSGCYYSYNLDRLFILMPYNDTTVLFSIAFMPEASFIGKKGAILNDDKDFTYIYTPTEGTNLSMLGWAKTKLYTSATISVYSQKADTPEITNFATFKWTSAGWNKLNVIETHHIVTGIERFIGGFKTFLESPSRPTREELAAEMRRLNSLNETGFFDAMQPYVDFLHKAQANNDILSEDDFKAMLDNNTYPTTFTYAALVSDLIKQYSKNRLAETNKTP